MQISMQLSYSGGFKEAADTVAELEQAGLDLVWVAEVYGFDAASLMGYLAAKTETVQIASGILPIYSRTPTLLAMTAASNVTGELLPIASLVELARRHGAAALIDAAQIAGWIDLDLPRLGADFVAFAGHKGPQAPWGIGGLYVSPRLAWPAPGYCDVGSVDRCALAGLAAFLREHGYERAARQVETDTRSQ